MKIQKSLFFLSLLLGTFLVHLRPTSATSEFIKKYCDQTLFPDVCYNSLITHADEVKQSSAQLAQVTIAVALSKAQLITTFMTRNSRDANDIHAVSALHDCVTNLNDAVDNIRGSLKEMRQLRSDGSSAASGLMLGNIQAWMDAALTNEDACANKFENIPDGQLKKNVLGLVSDAKKFTINAATVVYLHSQKHLHQ